MNLPPSVSLFFSLIAHFQSARANLLWEGRRRWHKMKPPWLSIAYPLHSLLLFLPSTLLPHNKGLEVKQDSLRRHFHFLTQSFFSYPPLTPTFTAVLGVWRFFRNILTSHQSDLDQCFGLRGMKSVGRAEFVTFPSKLFVSTQIRKSTSTDIQDKKKMVFQGSR